jgi:hypothetical protein
MGPASDALTVRAIKVEQAVREAAWLVAVRAHLRQGPATTHDLAKTAGVASGRYFGRFRSLLLKAPCIAKIGERPGPTGHINTLWSLVDDAGSK